MKAGIIILLIILLPLAQAADLEEMSSEDKAAFDEILEPVMKIYNFVKYASTLVAVIVLLIAGIQYMMSGHDPRKRETAKNMGMYVIIGMLVIWAAPMFVKLILS